MKLRVRIPEAAGWQENTLRLQLENSATVSTLQVQVCRALLLQSSGGGGGGGGSANSFGCVDPSRLCFSLNKTHFFRGPPEAPVRSFGVCGGDLLHVRVSEADDVSHAGGVDGTFAAPGAASPMESNVQPAPGDEPGAVTAMSLDATENAPEDPALPACGSAPTAADGEVSAQSVASRERKGGASHVVSCLDSAEGASAGRPDSQQCRRSTSGAAKASLVIPAVTPRSLKSSRVTLTPPAGIPEAAGQTAIGAALRLAHHAFTKLGFRQDASCFHSMEGNNGSPKGSSTVTLSYLLPCANGMKLEPHFDTETGLAVQNQGSGHTPPGSSAARCCVLSTRLGEAAVLVYGWCTNTGHTVRSKPRRLELPPNLVIPLSLGAPEDDQALRELLVKLMDELALPLMFDCYDAAGLGRPPVPSLLSLPPAVVAQILLPSLGVEAMASLGCTCKELCQVVEGAEAVWEMMYFRDIPDEDRKGWETPPTIPASEPVGWRARGAWKACFAAAWMRKKEREAREEEQRDKASLVVRDHRVPPFWWSPRRPHQGPIGHLPYVNPRGRIWGGDYDRLPGGGFPGPNGGAGWFV